MRPILLIALVGMFSVGCAAVKEKVSEKSNDNQKTLIKCSDKGLASAKDMECIDAAKTEGGKMKDMMK